MDVGLGLLLKPYTLGQKHDKEE